MTSPFVEKKNNNIHQMQGEEWGEGVGEGRDKIFLWKPRRV